MTLMISRIAGAVEVGRCSGVNSAGKASKEPHLRLQLIIDLANIFLRSFI